VREAVLRDDGRHQVRKSGRQWIEHLFVGDRTIDSTAAYQADFIAAKGVPAR
jgi:hypothetical protein